MKKTLLIILFLAWASVCQADEYWVYVRLEDRAGVKASDDVGRSKSGDVVAVLPISPQFIPSETEKKEWNIFKADLTKSQVEAMTQAWTEEKIDEETGDKILTLIAYRRNKIDLTALGATKPGLIETKVTADKIQLSAKTALDLVRYSRNQKFYAWVQRPLQILDNKIVRPAFASTVVSTVNKSGEDYNTLTLWEDAKDGNIVAAETVQIADCYDDDGTLIENPIIISGWVTSSTYYIHIKAADGNRHNGTIATGFHLKTTAETAVDLLIEEGWVRLSGCIIEKNSTGYNYQTVKVGAMDNASDEVWIYDNIVYSSTGKGMGIHSSSGNGKVYIWNNIVYDLNYADWGGGIYADEGTAYLYNNTIHNCYGSIQVDGSAVIYAKNNNCQDSVTSFDYAIFSSGTFHATSTNNIGSKTLAELCWGAAADSGTTDDAAANKLKDSDQNFLTTIKVGMVVKNTTDTTYSYVTAVDSNGILSLNDDIMANSENYTIYANMFGSVVFNDEAGDDFHLGATDTVAINKGYDTSGEAAPLNFTIDIDGDTRSTWDIGADEYVSEEPPAGRTRRMFLSMK